MKFRPNPQIIPILVYLITSLFTGWHAGLWMVLAIHGIPPPDAVFVGLLGSLTLFVAMWLVVIHRKAAAVVAALGCAAVWYWEGVRALLITWSMGPVDWLLTLVYFLVLIGTSSFTVREIFRRDPRQRMTG